ncbi:hypothetical protein BBD41_11135 [Paenibacillus ihbetae]|uniref:Uncharacterized protein n=1 Tax=Paenibacillus ihbetae TaxID=1870820 RepID=A0A1B2DZI0_9BACL|nr:hypothetical protein BBD41_11135 [Paenibacillus ihbetae]
MFSIVFGWIKASLLKGSSGAEETWRSPLKSGNFISLINVQVSRLQQRPERLHSPAQLPAPLLHQTPVRNSLPVFSIESGWSKASLPKGSSGAEETWRSPLKSGNFISLITSRFPDFNSDRSDCTSRPQLPAIQPL